MDWAELESIVPILAAALLSAPIGWERERSERPAGLRTHMLVGIASALLVVIGDAMLVRVSDTEVARVDPIRMTQAIVAGISFIGAGTIFTSRSDEGRVRGLTTAASLLAVAALGIACGVGLYLLAAASTLLILLVLGGLHIFEARIGTRSCRD